MITSEQAEEHGHAGRDSVCYLLEDKRALADAVVGSGEGWITEMSDSDLAALVALGGDD